MKPHPPLRLILGLAVIVLVGAPLEAETVFEANFDDTPPYQEGARLPITPDALGGKWYSDNVPGLPIVVSGEASLSAPCSLLLENTGQGFEPEQKATVWRSVDVENAVGVETAKTITRAFAFRISRVDGDENEFAAVLLPGPGGNLVYAIRIGVGGSVVVWKNGVQPEVIGSIEPEKWYEMEIITPNSEESEIHPVINLYSVKDTERGERIGSSDGPPLAPKTSRGAFVLFNNLPNSKIYYDNFLTTLDD